MNEWLKELLPNYRLQLQIDYFIVDIKIIYIKAQNQVNLHKKYVVIIKI